MIILFDEICKLIPNKCCRKYRVNGEFVIVTNCENNMLFLNSTASDVYLLCNGQSSIYEIYTSLASEYDVDPDHLKADLIKIIRDFQWNKIIELSRKKRF